MGLAFNYDGQRLCTIHVLGNVAQLKYTYSDLTAVIDPQGNTSRRWMDGNLVGFLIFSFIWLGPTIALAFWMRSAQLRYIRLYKEFHPESLIPDIQREPLFRWQIDDIRTAKELLASYHEEQENPVLEGARQVVSQRKNSYSVTGSAYRSFSFSLPWYSAGNDAHAR